MPRVDWYYHRPNCVTCKKSQDFLAASAIEIGEQVNAGKIRYEPAEALRLVRQAARLVAAKGKRIVDSPVSDELSDDELRALVIGPSGYLRAPAIRQGDTLFIGFAPGEFADKLLAAAGKKARRSKA